MTTIKATCPTCGEVGLSPEEIELRVDRAEAAESSYAFTCPSCMALIRKPADERIVRLLVGGGVAVVEVDSTPAGPRFPWPAITHDDLLDFHTLLETDAWFDQLAEEVRGQNAA